MAGSFPAQWIHGSPGCRNTEPPIQVHPYNDDTFVLRQSKCADPGTAARPGPSFEAPFMYLLFGGTTALLLDSGGTASPRRFPIAATVRQLIDNWLQLHQQRSIRLIVCHSHSHNDHSAGDAQFLQEAVSPDARAQVVGADLASMTRMFAITDWPNGRGQVDLGGRVIDVIPIPGHDDHHIALYDRQTQLLFTGDSLYPGLLFINDLPAYRDSIVRLTQFLSERDRPIAHILGAHIEMKRRPGKFFGYPHPFFQPDEHVLQLEARHLFELRDIVLSTGTETLLVRRDDFIVFHGDPQDIPPEDP